MTLTSDDDFYETNEFKAQSDLMKHDIWYEYMNKYGTKTQFVDKDYHFELVLEISNQTKILKSMWPMRMR